MYRNKFLCALVLLTSFFVRVEPRRLNSTFPDGFKFGAASSAYQIEGAWNIDGKGESIWDHLLHTNPTYTPDRSNGDVACDSYHRYKEDVQMLRFLGVNYYRFSISWPRIFPNGFTNVVNQPGVDYYNNLINELLKYNITPYVTLYHWDLPQVLQDFGGWTNSIIVDIFADYSRFIFKTYGDRVKLWITFNEIRQMCYDGYNLEFAPHIAMSGTGDYLCVYTTLLAHAKVYHIYDEEFRKTQNGRIGMSISTFFKIPASNKSEDLEATEIDLLFDPGSIADPIFSSSGDFPKEVKDIVAKKSKEQNFTRSRLPSFTNAEIHYIKGTADFYGLNHYTSYLVDKPKVPLRRPIPSFADDAGVHDSLDINSWLKVVPEGFRGLLNWIKNRYGNPEMIVFENGYSDKGEINDVDRINYYRLYLEAMLDAIDDGCNVTHYTAWSLMDNFEWAVGYREKFGLFHVDFNSPNRTRTPKASAFVYKEIIRSNRVNWNYNPKIINNSTKKRRPSPTSHKVLN